MQEKIEERTDFQSRVYNNRIELLKAIKEHTLNYEESRYEIGIVTDALRSFLNCQKKYKEPLLDYMKRFKTSQEIMQNHLGGAIILKNFVAALPDYDKTDEDKTQK